MPNQPSVPDIGKCANPDCKVKFHRMGNGVLTVLMVKDSSLWGLPPDIRQKVVWMCDKCASRFSVRLDRKTHTIQLEHRPQKGAAA